MVGAHGINNSNLEYLQATKIMSCPPVYTKIGKSGPMHFLLSLQYIHVCHRKMVNWEFGWKYLDKFMILFLQYMTVNLETTGLYL